jgi:periplasmic protein TonB
MRTEQILSADMLDILFDNRNKCYGAYDLRKHYGKRLAKSLGITFTLAAVAVFCLLFLKKEKVITPVIPDIFVRYIYEVPKPASPEPPEPKPPQIKPAVKIAGQIFVKRIVITKNESQATPLAKNLDSMAITGKTLAGLIHGPALIKELDSPATGTTAKRVSEKMIDKITPVHTAEVMPAYPGGMEALRKFLQRHLQNPEDMEPGRAIAVKIKFVVGYDGILKSFETIEDGGAAFNEEVIRVLKKMPGWIPGKTNGQNVSVYYTIPVKFTAAE